MIKSRSYQTTAGLNYIQSPDLVFATVYAVKREGIEHNKYVSGTTNRTHIHDASAGKISFPTVFTAGETVFVIYKTPTGSEPDPVCMPGSFLSSTTFFDGLVGVPYNKIIILGGTPPYVVTVVNKPSWMTISNSFTSISFYGTPDAAIDNDPIQLTVTNCAGFFSMDETITINPTTANVEFRNDSGTGAYINSVSGFSYSISSGSFPLNSGSAIIGVHGNFIALISVVVNGVTFPVTLRLVKNGTTIQTKNITSSGTQTFTAVAYLTADDLKIILE